MAVTQGRHSSASLLVLAFVAMGVYAGNEWFTTVGVQLAKDGGLLLTRVHPGFERALLDSRLDTRLDTRLDSRLH